MNTKEKVAVCSRSFSKNKVLRAELLARYSQVTFNDTGRQLERDSLIEFLSGHEKAITALEKMDNYVLSSLPELKVIGKYGVGLDMIDLDAMHQYGKLLGWTSGVNRRSAAELTLAFAILMLRHIITANREVLTGTWRQHKGGLLSGRTVGIIGCGNIGKDLVKLLQPFGCSILVNDIRNYGDFYAEYDIKAIKLEELLAKADIVTLHLPLDKSTIGILNAERLALMKPSAILINAARGGLVNEKALKELLETKQLAGAAFDVFADEPPQDRELLNLPNFLATPHIGGSAEEAILAMGMAAIDGLENAKHPLDFL
jgi:phosphoglycerate dehydrogenase-like enzyme